MSPLYVFFIVWGCLLPMSYAGTSDTHLAIPRKTVAYRNELKTFREEGIWNYTAMLVREDLGLLLLGSRDAIYALDIDNITDKKAAVYWNVTKEEQRKCSSRTGKDADMHCRNYIRTLHALDDGEEDRRMYVCGTYAFKPTCDYVNYSDGQLSLEGKLEDGRGKCPFDPFLRHSSLMVGNDLYSATAAEQRHIIGNEHSFTKFHSSGPIRNKQTWLSDPVFINMDFVNESAGSADGDDDKVYMFFTEKADEYGLSSKLSVSLVARVCKGDMGGKEIKKKWTSFQKARLECPMNATQPSVVQDVFLLKRPDWKESVFYVVFTSQSSSSELVSSAVCAYSVSAIGDVFSKGTYMSREMLNNGKFKWVTYAGKLPDTRPGACINNAAREKGINSSLQLPDETLKFIRKRPLMNETVRPLNEGRPLMVTTKGPLLTRIVVDSVLALDGERYPVVFVGTDNGYVQKAVNYTGDMFIIEEIQLYEDPNPIKTLRLSDSSKGRQMYAGSEFGAVQIPVSDCVRHESCADCVLARDPYCAWDTSSDRCRPVSTLAVSSSDTAIQSLKEGDFSRCPELAVVDVALVPGNNVLLPCRPDLKLAQVHWRLSDRILHSDGSKHYYVDGGGFLLIRDTSESDAGLYTCVSSGWVDKRVYNRTRAVYRLKTTTTPTPTPTTTPTTTTPTTTTTETTEVIETVVGLTVAVALLSLLSLSLVIALTWTCFRKHRELESRAKRSHRHVIG